MNRYRVGVRMQVELGVESESVESAVNLAMSRWLSQMGAAGRHTGVVAVLVVDVTSCEPEGEK